MLSTESKRREVLQLLQGYRTWHTGRGGAIAWEDSHIAQAAYGPAGMIYAGMEYRDYSEDEVRRLEKSYEHLEHAITIEKATPEGFAAWVLLHGPYFGDPADPSLVRLWRELDDYRIEWHDRFVWRLAHHLRHKRLYPIEPKHLTEAQNKAIENKNAEMYASFQRLRSSGYKEDDAAGLVAEDYHVEKTYILRIVEFRHTLKTPTCLEPGCDRRPERGTLCMKHYMQARRRGEEAS